MLLCAALALLSALSAWRLVDGTPQPLPSSRP
jgi:hypothetical protein